MKRQSLGKVGDFKTNIARTSSRLPAFFFDNDYLVTFGINLFNGHHSQLNASTITCFVVIMVETNEKDSI